MIKLEKRIELCTECALGYYKAIWEPMWLAKIMWKRAHAQTHTREAIENVSQDYRNGQEDERERIIKLIEDNTMTMTSPLDSTIMRSLRMSPSELIALIKGENK